MDSREAANLFGQIEKDYCRGSDPIFVASIEVYSQAAKGLTHTWRIYVSPGKMKPNSGDWADLVAKLAIDYQWEPSRQGILIL